MLTASVAGCPKKKPKCRTLSGQLDKNRTENTAADTSEILMRGIEIIWPRDES
jgi:hypothetical protein